MCGANSTYSKTTVIQSARENIEVIRLYVRLLKDLDQIGVKKIVQVNEKIESVSKQLAAWQRSSKGTDLSHVTNTPGQGSFEHTDQ